MGAAAHTAGPRFRLGRTLLAEEDTREQLLMTIGRLGFEGQLESHSIDIHKHL